MDTTALLMICTTFLAEHLLAAGQGLAVGWVPCPRTLGRRRQLQVAMTFGSSPKNHRHPEAGPFSAGDWTSIQGPLTTGALTFEDGGNSIAEHYLARGMSSNTF